MRALTPARAVCCNFPVERSSSSILGRIGLFGAILALGPVLPLPATGAAIQEETLVEPAARNLESAAAYHYVRGYQGEIQGDLDTLRLLDQLGFVMPAAV